jgi:hypothetical protein
VEYADQHLSHWEARERRAPRRWWARDGAEETKLRIARHLDLSEERVSARRLSALLEAVWVRRVSEISLRRCGVDARLLRVLLASPAVAGLTHMDLSGNGLGTLDATILATAGTTLRSLRSLDVHFNHLGDRGLEALVAAPWLEGLERLSLRNNSVGPAGSLALAATPMGRLRSLDLSFNPIGGSGLAGLASWGALSTVETLDLWGCGVDPEGVAALASSRSVGELRRLDLGSNGLGPAGVRALIAADPAAWRVSSLQLALNGIGDEGAELLASWPPLAHVDELGLEHNEIGDSGIGILMSSPFLSDMSRRALRRARA